MQSLVENNTICVTFIENNKFEYIHSGCLGINIQGHGVYSISNSLLVLKFDKNTTEVKRNVSIEELKRDSKKDINLEFEIKDPYGTKVWMDIIRLSDSTSFRIDEIEPSIKVIKSAEIDTYRIQFIDYETVDIELNHNSDKKIKVQLVERGPTIISNKEIIYNLSENKLEFYNDKNNPYGLNIFKKVLQK